MSNLSHNLDSQPLRSSTDGEFSNLMNMYELQLKRNIILSEIDKAKELDLLYRKNILSEYYNIPIDSINKLIDLSLQERNEICAKEKINPFIFRTLFDYNRYYDCHMIYNFLSSVIKLKDKNILDFGCLVSDYGFYFGMLGMVVTICDLKDHADFADFRLAKAEIKRLKVYAPCDYFKVTKNKDLIIFGEVLEHLYDPYELLECCVRNQVKYIYTSCYPYGSEAYFNYSGHTKEAKAQSPLCIELLRENYEEIIFFDFKRLWIKKTKEF